MASNALHGTTNTVTLLSTFTWYTGTGQPAQNEHDTESIAIQEIGHLLGLAHIPDLTSAMSGQIQPGQAIRTIVAHDQEILGELYGPGPASVSFAGGILRVRGTEAANTIGIDSDGTNLDVTIDGLTTNDAAVIAATSQIQVISFGGNDTITFGVTTTGLPEISVPALVLAGSGNDSIVSAAGNDSLVGGIGDDTLTGGLGNDTLIGGTESDRLRETSTVASITLTLTDSSLTGGLGSDILSGIEQASVTGGSGDDTINGSGFTGAATLLGLGGADSLVGGNGSDSLVGDAGNDTLSGSGAGTDTLDGGANDDRILVGANNESVLGGAGNDTFVFDNTSAGVDTVSGGSETDLLDFSLRTSAITLNLGMTGANQDIDPGAGMYNLNLTAADLENVTGTALGDSITGNSLANSLAGGAGNDTIRPGTGDDVIDGGSDAGGGDVDRLVEVLPSAGTLTLNSTQLIGLGTDTYSNIEQVSLVGSAGNDTLNAGSATIAVTLDGGNGSDSLVGGTGNDLLIDDAMTGANGSDTLVGGPGDDTYRFGNVSTAQSAPQNEDRIVEQLGGGTNDTVDFSQVTVAVTMKLVTATKLANHTKRNVDYLSGTPAATIENAIGGTMGDNITGTTSANSLEGGNGNDTITAGEGADTLRGGNGNDLLKGLNGDDLLDGGNDNDNLQAGSNNDILMGGFGADTLTGSNQNDNLLGGDGPDRLSGQNNNDTLDGGPGTDPLLNCGKGPDTINGSVDPGEPLLNQAPGCETDQRT